MSKDERILRKVGKLLALYGVNPEEKEKFLKDLQDKKYDEEEAEPGEEENLETEEKEEVKVEEEPGETKPETEVEEVEEEKVAEKEPAEEGEKVEGEQEELTEETKVEGEEEQVEQPGGEEEKVEEEVVNEFDYKSGYDELKKSNEGLSARVKALEEIVAELGVEKEEDKTIGANPAGNAIDETYNSAFDEINRKRVGY